MGATPRTVDWLSDWDRQLAGARQLGYIEQELRRIEQKGEPLLMAALNLPFMDQTDAVVKVLRERLQYTQVYLRLHPEADAPPDTDPDGHALPDSKRGKVLVAKVGVKGQTADGKAPDSEADTPMTSGLGRIAMRDRLQQSLYRTREISAKPTQMPIEDAIVILRQWGVGMKSQFRKRGARPHISQWLVEELPQIDGEPVIPASENKPKPSAKSAA